MSDFEEPIYDVNFHSIIAQTDKAICFKLAPGFTGSKIWIPRSVLGHVDHGSKMFEVPQWFADQEGL